MRFGYGCASLALRTTLDDTFMASQVFLPRCCCSHRHTRFREFASIPGRIYGYSRSPGSCTRLCAVIHLCEGQGVARAAWLDAALTTASGTDLERLDSLRDPPDGFSLLLARKGDAWERQVSKELFRDKDVIDLSGGTLRASGTRNARSATYEHGHHLPGAPLFSTFCGRAGLPRQGR